MKWLKKLFKRDEYAQPVERSYVDQLDPRGDGTIREGDPMFDLMMQCMESGKAMITEVDEHGNIIITNRKVE